MDQSIQSSLSSSPSTSSYADPTSSNLNILSPYVPTPGTFIDRLIPLLKPYLEGAEVGTVPFIDIGSGEALVFGVVNLIHELLWVQ